MTPDIPDDDMPVLDMSDVEPVAEPVDLTPVLTRQLAWDCLPCAEVEGVLCKLGMTPGSAEGIEIEHDNSHARILTVMPMEAILQQLSSVLGSVISVAMTEHRGITDDMGEGMEMFAEQNAEVALASSRAVLAQLFEEGIIMYTPEAQLVMS